MPGKAALCLCLICFAALPLVARAQAQQEPASIGLMVGVPLAPHKINQSAPKMGFIDSGVQEEHPQIKGVVAEQKDFTGEGVGDPIGHGTRVVLVYLRSHFETNSLAANLAEKSGKVDGGVAPIFMAKIVGRRRVGTQVIADRMAEAVEWLATVGAKVVNISMALPDGAADYKRLCDAVAKQQSSTVYAVAAGNVPDAIFYPGNCGSSSIIVVGAATSGGRAAEYSGPSDILAPEAYAPVAEDAYHYAAAADAYEKGDYADAAVQLEAGSQKGISVEFAPRYRHLKGLLLIKQEKLSEARHEFEQAIALDPQFRHAYMGLHEVFIRQEMFPEAAQNLEAALAKGLDDDGLRENFGRTYLDLLEPEKAKAQFAAIANRGSASAEVRQLDLLAGNQVMLQNAVKQRGDPAGYLPGLIEAGDARLVVFLVRKFSVDVNKVAPGTEVLPLTMAAGFERGNMVQSLIALGADPNLYDPKYRLTPLMLASTKQNVKLIQMLLDLKVGLDVQDYAGYTALMFAAESGCLECVSLLVSAGADSRPRSNDGLDALGIAEKFKRQGVVEFLKGEKR